MGRFELVKNIIISGGDMVSRHTYDDAVAQIRGPGTASKYIDTQPEDTGDKLVSAASDASDEAA